MLVLLVSGLVVGVAEAALLPVQLQKNAENGSYTNSRPTLHAALLASKNAGWDEDVFLTELVKGGEVRMGFVVGMTHIFSPSAQRRIVDAFTLVDGRRSFDALLGIYYLPAVQEVFAEYKDAWVLTSKHPVAAAKLAESKATGVYTHDPLKLTAYPFEQLIGFHLSMDGFGIEYDRNSIKALAVAQAKPYLRKKGKSFVAKEKDGKKINPIEDAIKPVVDALNAPELAGLEAALRELGFNVADVPRTNTVEATRIAEEVMLGKLDLKTSRVNRIMVLLGPDGYNKWVKKYNDGE
jgi:hypothetical protein